MSNKRRRPRPTPTEVARVLDPMSKPDPLYAVTCHKAGVNYGEHSAHTPPRYLTDRGIRGLVFEPEDFWMSDSGTVYQWQPETETYLPVGHKDDPPPGLAERIIESLNMRTLGLTTPVGVKTLAPDGYGTSNVPGGWGGE